MNILGFVLLICCSLFRLLFTFAYMRFENITSAIKDDKHRIGTEHF